MGTPGKERHPSFLLRRKGRKAIRGNIPLSSGNLKKEGRFLGKGEGLQRRPSGWKTGHEGIK